MAERMLEKKIEVYSEKYDVHGIIKDYGVVEPIECTIAFILLENMLICFQ